MNEIVATAERLTDDLLFSPGLATECTDAVPVELTRRLSPWRRGAWPERFAGTVLADGS
jgi:hypothetical protein